MLFFDFVMLMPSFSAILESVFCSLLFSRRELLFYSVLMVLCIVHWNFIL
jgi:hypothetical protein